MCGWQSDDDIVYLPLNNVFMCMWCFDRQYGPSIANPEEEEEDYEIEDVTNRLISIFFIGDDIYECAEDVLSQADVLDVSSIEYDPEED
jgi:hypothetical protein